MKTSWPRKTLGEVCQVRGGGTPSKAVERYWRGDIPWVSPKDMKFDVVSDSIDHISREAIDGSATSLIPKDSVLMVVRSGILARTVPIAITERDLTINQDLKALCPNRGVDARFLYHLLDSKMDVLLSMVSRGATVHRLVTDQIRTLDFILPPLPEQQRIVGILDEAFEGLTTAKANAEKNLRNAHALFESHLDSVFAQRGKGWVEKPLGDLATFRNGINYTKDSKGEQIKIVGVRNFQKHFSAPLDDLDTVTIDGKLSELDSLKKDDILAVRSNGNIELIGRCILVGEVAEKISHSGFTIRIRLSNGSVISKYVCHFMKSAGSRKLLTEGGTGTNIKSLNQGMLSALVIPFPSIAAQKALVKQIERLSEETKRLESIYRHKLAAMDELKKSLLHQAFTGAL